MKKLVLVVVGLVAVMVLGPGESQSQQGGFPQGGRGGGFTPDPGAMFDRMSGGKGYIALEDVNGRFRDTFVQYMQANNITNGRITKDQFTQAWNQRMQARGGPGGGTPRSVTAVTPQPGGLPGAAPQAFGQQPWQGRGGNRGGGGNMGRMMRQAVAAQQDLQTVDAEAEVVFKDLDRDSDGFISKEEATNSLRAEFSSWDKDQNGKIDLNEFKEYYRNFKSKQLGWNNPFGFGQQGQNNDDEKRPVVYRKGHLPPELTQAAPWFADLSRNSEEGQVFLYDWLNAGKAESEFTTMDRNGDGILTVEEVAFAMKIKLGADNNPGAESRQPVQFAGNRGGGMNLALMGVNFGGQGFGGPRGFGGGNNGGGNTWRGRGGDNGGGGSGRRGRGGDNGGGGRRGGRGGDSSGGLQRRMGG